jgi:transposase
MDYPDAVIAKAKRMATLIERVEQGESLTEVNRELGASISPGQLAKLRAKYETGGREWKALLDGRFGHDVKAHSALKEWLYERKRQDSTLRAPQLAKEIGEKFGVELSDGHINHLLRKRGLTAAPGRPFKQTEATEEQEASEGAATSQENAGLFFPGGSKASPGG